ncbi:hypothetical protein RA210_U140018 [Rubrivivax sp. A210]|uniref:PD40 domain-containing protein n=1 Tax=Rubrivivax sp. A210 TaxID=2772301 RepID=UPI00191A3796|nr:PD40 domain-containing protein [Rubrivivax sp. A210]CAD5370999.1 hypothetical protein RA210_U140018 [Rubrivivax sp. A210]
MRQHLNRTLERPARGLGRTLWLAGALALALLAGGCGGGSSSDPAPTPAVSVPIGPPVTQTVGTAGGTVQATASGVKVSLSIPDGALASDTVVSITPLAPAAGDVVSVSLAPGGFVFAKPVTVVLEYPAGQVPGARASLRQRLGTADSYVATTVDTAARTLSARLTTFGGTALDTLAQPAVAGAPVDAGRARALNARALADPPPAAEGTLSASSTTTAAEMVASARRQVTIMESEGDFVSAFALQASMASLIMRRGDPNFPVDAMVFLGDAHDTACRALSDAIEKARTAPVTKLADFKPLRQKLGGWWRITEAGDINQSGCPGASVDTFMDAGLALTQREIDFQKLRLAVVRTPNDLKEPSEAVKVARRAKRDLEALQAAADALDLPPLPLHAPGRAYANQARALATRGAASYAGIIQTQLLDPLVTPVREAAWTVAKDSQTLAHYPSVMEAFGGVPALAQDVQFVRTRIEVRINNASGELLGRSVLGFDAVPDTPANPKRTDSLTVNKGGTVAISGNIANLECASAGTETLKVTFDDAEVATVSAGGGNLLAGALSTLTPTRLLQAAGLPADDTGTHTLRIRRSNSPCAATLGISDDLLATVTLSFAAERRIYFSATTGGDYEGPGIESINADGTGHAVNTINPAVPWCVPDGDTPSCNFAASAQDQQPALSPDGTQLVFSRPHALGANNPDGIMLASANGGGIRPLTDAQGLEVDHSPSWSPDGRRVAYVHYSGDSSQPQSLRVVNLDGSGAVQLANITALSGTAWSPDGKTIAFARGADSPGVYLVAADGSGPPRQLVSSDSASLTSSAWSPDGRRIAFHGYGTSGNRGIQVVSADGTGPATLMDAMYFPPAWSPDGSELAYVGCAGTGCPIHVLKIENGTVRQLSGRVGAGMIRGDLSWR